MALTLQGFHKASIFTGLITLAEVRQAGSGSFLGLGRIGEVHLSVTPLTKKGDPANTDYVHAIRYAVEFDMLQTKKTAELAAMAGTAGTGLYETDVEIKVTYATGRAITLGAASGYPLRAVLSFGSSGSDGAQMVHLRAENDEPITSFAAKVSA